jgi:hypothetical protein
MRHNAGKQKILRGMSEREKCATCPQIIEYLEEIKMTANKDSKKTICVACGREGLKIAARGMCKKCYYQAIKSGDKVRNRTEAPTDKPGVKPTVTDSKDAKADTKTAEAEAKPPETKVIFINSPSTADSALFIRITELEKECERLRLWVDRLTKAVAA